MKIFKFCVCVFVSFCIMTENVLMSTIVHALDSICIQESDTSTIAAEFKMVPADENGRPLADPILTATFDCGSVTLIASRSLVSVKVKQTMGWVLWDFTRSVDDTLGDDHYFYQYNIGRNSFVESYSLETPGLRTLTLTGTARDVSALQQCVVLPGTFINHDSTERA